MVSRISCIALSAVLAIGRWSVAADVIDIVKDLGCPNHGEKGSASIINRAIGQGAGKSVYVPEGIYLLEDSIVPVSGTKLTLSPKAEMRRGFDGGNTGQAGALVQGDKSFSVTDVTIKGGRWTNPEHQFPGRVITVIGDRWTIDSVQVESWGTAAEASICMSVMGSQVMIRNCKATGSAERLGQAGIRIQSGKNIRVSDCYMEAGDDTFCAFPTERAASFGSGLPIEDVVFERCGGKSFKARFLACGLTAVNSMTKNNAGLNDLNNVKVNGISFIDCQGETACEKPFGPAFFVVCANPNPGAGVGDVKFLRCSGKVAKTADQCVKITAAEGASCQGVLLDQCKLSGGIKEPVTVGRGCKDVVVTSGDDRVKR